MVGAGTRSWMSSFLLLMWQELPAEELPGPARTRGVQEGAGAAIATPPATTIPPKKTKTNTNTGVKQAGAKAKRSNIQQTADRLNTGFQRAGLPMKVDLT